MTTTLQIADAVQEHHALPGYLAAGLVTVVDCISTAEVGWQVLDDVDRRALAAQALARSHTGGLEEIASPEVRHDLRNALTPVRMSLSMLVDDWDALSEPEQLKLLDLASEGATMLDRCLEPPVVDSPIQSEA